MLWQVDVVMGAHPHLHSPLSHLISADLSHLSLSLSPSLSLSLALSRTPFISVSSLMVPRVLSHCFCLLLPLSVHSPVSLQCELLIKEFPTSRVSLLTSELGEEPFYSLSLSFSLSFSLSLHIQTLNTQLN